MRDSNNDKMASNASIIRVHKDKNYTVMSNKHLFQRDLSLKAKGLMSVFLALPDDWNYSISGLCKIVKEGKDALNATISELKKFGYIDIERQNAERGRFTFIYHIYEQGKIISPCTGFPCTVNAYSENPNAVSPTAVQPNTENPQQLNIKELNTKEQNTNDKTLVNPTSGFTFDDLKNLYDSICVHFPKVTKITDSRKKKAELRLKVYPEKSFWETVFKKAENSNFVRSGKFFCFDWVLKNNENALKVFEGNYDNNKGNNKVVPVEFSAESSSKYSECYK